MSAALVAALIFTVILPVITAYFVMGSVPLLILEHDTPMDSRFVRGFFNTYCLAAMVVASATAVSYALAGKWVFAAGSAALAVGSVILRRTVIPKMDSLCVKTCSQRRKCHSTVPPHARDRNICQPGAARRHRVESHRSFAAIEVTFPNHIHRCRPP